MNTSPGPTVDFSVGAGKFTRMLSLEPEQPVSAASANVAAACSHSRLDCPTHRSLDIRHMN
ncbi:MAG TPA: hypothetical protein VEQ58_00780, partial [Polyangiaceae bacterium]|nr:hypothetical protein [Polyangiaceae bacterium]